MSSFLVLLSTIDPLYCVKELVSEAVKFEKRASAEHAPRINKKNTPRKRKRRLVFMMWLFIYAKYSQRIYIITRVC
jgi:hypothetical protein